MRPKLTMEEAVKKAEAKERKRKVNLDRQRERLKNNGRLVTKQIDNLNQLV